MKKLILAATLLGLAACANTRNDAVRDAAAANAPAAECCGACAEGEACCAEGAKAAEAAEGADVEVCPVTGARGTGH